MPPCPLGQMRPSVLATSTTVLVPASLPLAFGGVAYVTFGNAAWAEYGLPSILTSTALLSSGRTNLHLIGQAAWQFRHVL